MLMLILFILSDSTFAEGGCPPGTYPANPPATNICNPFPGNQSNGQPQQTQGRWETRWGAIAIDETVGTFGAVKNFASKRLATKAAVAACKANAGMRCEARLSYYNQCAVIAWGDTGYATQGAETVKIASDLGLEACNKFSRNCKIYYADCSPAVWIQ